MAGRGAGDTSATQLAVIGAGPGGYAAAFLAADLGMAVTLIGEEPNPGGVCLYRGCIPSKALLHVAKVIGEAREAKAWGVEFSEPALRLEKLRSWKAGVVGKLTGGLGELVKRRQVRYVQGRARFVNGRTLRVSGLGAVAAGGETEITFEHAIIATGSRAATLPFLQSGSPRVMDSTSALEIEAVPPRLLVIGGGYIGLELGTVYAALGSAVTLVEMTGSLLPGVDADLVRPLARRIEQGFEAVLLDTVVTGAEERGDGMAVTLESRGADGAGGAGGREAREARFDRLLVAVGRQPNSADLGLENTHVELDERGFIRVDEMRRTGEEAIFAIGDVAGEPMLAHKASHEGRTAVEAIAGHKVAFEPQAIPAVVFTDPEVAWCGLTETAAADSKRAVEVARFPWAASGRAATLGRAEGLTKLVVDPVTERVLGVGIVGSGAGELIAEGVLAVEMAARATDVKLAIHAHPTLSETIMESAEALFGQATHLYRPRAGG